ncbi:apolipoprotein N-acyltransferase [Blastomonas sp.]|uniref:apolipoprotein N-acyltransferase n=1 Tax=Blastomonas sp. TaxID=1909299 RepID=UPI003593638B
MLTRFPRLTALAAGAVSATGFAPLNLWPLTLAAFALLIHLVMSAPGRRSAFARGWLFGVGYFTVGLNWIAIAFTYQDEMPHWLGWVAVVGLSMYLALFPGLAALGAFAASRLRLPRAGRGSSSAGPEPRSKVMGSSHRGETDLVFILVFAALWLITEWMRAWVFTGFAWNPLGVVAVDAGWAARLIGTYGLSALMMLGAGALLLLVQRHWLQSGAIATFALAFSGAGWLAAGPTPVVSGPAITIAQPNNDQSEKYDPDAEAKNFSRLVTQTVNRDAPSPRIVFWPEAAIPDFLEDGYPRRLYFPETAAGIRARVTRPINNGDLLVTGGVKLDFDANGRAVAAANSVFALSSAGEILGSYDKSHLVPGGEYLPYAEVLGLLGLSRLVPGEIGFTPGPGAQTLDLGGFGKMGLQVCYEIIFSGEVVDRTHRPDFIFNPSNDAWFGSWGPPQHLAQARLRALEEGLPVIRATPTGISAVVDADGRVLHSIAHHRAGRIDTQLPGPRTPTPFALWGNILALAFAGLLLLLAVAQRAFGR